ncbi:hypothetical protein JQS43_07510 [Natronosporangium hydrolyticum]|uniref:Uncharacterized protein n=1 Tax=Natronosporangium hydrolyticum TaxID=2811111 RepID=A0A895YPV2_9ACTN|nr:hypothetical protein [Natronosporangium hydrolyticum]QSB16140.1 hypothetical protein JQS43_07510 [Natronosporangium hydrolyticum]
MFVQVIHGHISDRDEMYDAMQSWARDLAPGAEGWLGTTAGVTADDEFIALVRFESPEAAQRNSHRPEQHQWWMETSKLFLGSATFHDCTDVDTFLQGGSDQAGFVQILQGRSSDPAQLVALTKRHEDGVRSYRPDIIGGLIAHHGDAARFTEAVYFTSEAEARTGERKSPPPELADLFSADSDLYADLRYLDLPEPWLYSPSG